MKRFFYSFIVLFFVFSGVLRAGDITVTSLLDDSSGGTLREVISSAGDGDRIIFDSSISGGTITITGSYMEIGAKTITIESNSSNPVTITTDGSVIGGDKGRIFNIAANGHLILKNLNFESISHDSMGIIYANGNPSSLNINNCNFKNNSTSNIYGASIIYANGGGNAPVTIASSSFLNNSSTGTGGVGAGAIYTLSPLKVANSTFSGNSSAVQGGAIYYQFKTGHELNNVSFVNNSAVKGGALAVVGTDNGIVSMKNCLFWGNSASDSNTGNHIYQLWISSDNMNRVVSEGYNFLPDSYLGEDGNGKGSISLTSATGDIFDDSSDPKLGTLIQDSDGVIWAYPLLSDSPLIDSGSCTDINDVIISQDQFGNPRDDGSCDIGAIEYVAPLPIIVTSTSDSGAGSLREAITNANSGDTIVFDSNISGQTITLSSTLTIDKNITIKGDSSNSIIIDGNSTIRPFTLSNSVVNISDLVIQNGYAKNETVGSADGGAIYVDALSVLNIDNVHFTNNVAGTTGNENGGAIEILTGSVVTVKNSSFVSNSAPGGEAGAIDNHGILYIINVTFANNTAYHGGAIRNDGSIYLDNSTIANNTADSGSGYGGGIRVVAGTLLFKNSVFYNNTALTGPNINYESGTVNSNGYNFLPDASSATTISNTTGDIFNGDPYSDPKLGTLTKDSNGITWGYTLQSDSPLVDGGACTFIDTSAIGTDQFDNNRSGGGCDIGALEYQFRLDDGLVAHYQFEDNVNDSVGDYNGTSIGNLTYSDFGKFGKAASFNGTDSYITTSLGLASSSYTKSVWMKTSEVIGNLVSSSDDSHSVWMGDTDGSVSTNHNSTDNTVVQSTTTLNNNNWHHVAVTYNLSTTTLTLYVDGVQESQSTSIAAASSGTVYIGSYGAAQVVFSGLIDDVRIYDRAFSASEIASLYTYVPSLNLIGTTGNDTLNGNSNDDIITGLGGNDTINGGDGNDTAVFSGNSWEYTFYDRGDSYYDISGPDGNDTIAYIEYLSFDDKNGTVTSFIYPPKLFLKTHGGVVLFDKNSTLNIDKDISGLVKHTVEMWINTENNWEEENLTVIGDLNSTYIRFYKTDIGSLKLELVYNGTLSKEYETASVSTFDGKWHHIAYKFYHDDTNLTDADILIDGIIDSSVSTNNAVGSLSFNGDIKIGQNFKGMIDEFRLWNSTKSESTIYANKNIQIDPASYSTLLSYYNFDERVGNTIKDLSGNGYDGTIEENITRFNFLGNSLNFDGNSTYVTVPFDDTFSMAYDENSTKFTFNSWIKTSASTSYQTIFEQVGSDVGELTRIIYVDGSRVGIVLSSDGQMFDGDNESSSDVNDGSWHYVSFVIDGADIYIYIDGVLDSNHTNTTFSSATASTSDGYIGGNFSSSYFNGNIAELTLWNKTLTQTEIQELMISSPDINDSNLIAYWPLNEGAGIILKDYSINGNDGNISNENWIENAPKIYGDTIYTNKGIVTHHQLVVENNTTTPTYSYNGNLPSSILNFNGSNGTFNHYQPIEGNYTIDISATDAGVNLNNLFKVVVYKGLNNSPVFSTASIDTASYENVNDYFDNVKYYASDSDGDMLIYSISGSDAGFFEINSSDAKIYFLNPLDYENPQDYDANNIYEFNVTASDGELNVTIPYSITIMDEINESLVVTLTLSNLNLSEHNISSIYLIGQDENNETLEVSPGYIYTDGNHTISSPIYNIDQNFSIQINLANGETYKYSFYDYAIYKYPNTEYIKTSINANLSNFNIDMSNTNWHTFSSMYDNGLTINESVTLDSSISVISGDVNINGDFILETNGSLYVSAGDINIAGGIINNGGSLTYDDSSYTLNVGKTVPTALSDINVTIEYNPTRVIFNWNYPYNDNYGFNILRDGVEINNTIEANATTYTDTNVTELQTYSYVISVDNQYGEANSTERNITVPLGLSIKLYDVNMSENNITNLYIEGQGDNNESFDIPGFTNIPLSASSIITTVPVYNNDKNFSIAVELWGNKKLWFNFDDNKLYEDNTTSNLITEINSTNNIFDINMSYLNFVLSDTPPYFTNILVDVNTTEDNDTLIFPINVMDANSDPITLSVSSTDYSIAEVYVDYNNSTIVINPYANQYGTINIELNATANGKTTTQNFSVYIEPVNDTPSIDTNFTSLSISENKGTIIFDINISDVDGDDLNLSVESNDTNILNVNPNWKNNLTQGDYDGVTLDFNTTTTNDSYGMVQIFIKVVDEYGASNAKTFDINVTEVVEDNISSITYIPLTILLENINLEDNNITSLKLIGDINATFNQVSVDEYNISFIEGNYSIEIITDDTTSWFVNFSDNKIYNASYENIINEYKDAETNPFITFIGKSQTNPLLDVGKYNFVKLNSTLEIFSNNWEINNKDFRYYTNSVTKETNNSTNGEYLSFNVSKIADDYSRAETILYNKNNIKESIAQIKLINAGYAASMQLRVYDNDVILDNDFLDEYNLSISATYDMVYVIKLFDKKITTLVKLTNSDGQEYNIFTKDIYPYDENSPFIEKIVNLNIWIENKSVNFNATDIDNNQIGEKVSYYFNNINYSPSYADSVKLRADISEDTNATSALETEVYKVEISDNISYKYYKIVPFMEFSSTLDIYNSITPLDLDKLNSYGVELWYEDTTPVLNIFQILQKDDNIYETDLEIDQNNSVKNIMAKTSYINTNTGTIILSNGDINVSNIKFAKELNQTQLTNLYNTNNIDVAFPTDSIGYELYEKLLTNQCEIYSDNNINYVSINDFIKDHTYGNDGYLTHNRFDRTKVLMFDNNLTNSVVEVDINTGEAIIIGTYEILEGVPCTKQNTSTMVTTDSMIRFDFNENVKGYENKAYFYSNSNVNDGSYTPQDSVKQIYLLNNIAAKYLTSYLNYNTTPVVKKPVTDLWTYLSLPADMTICTKEFQTSSPDICNKEFTIESVFGNTDQILKHTGFWSYWESDSNNTYDMPKLSSINAKEGLLIKSSTQNILNIPYSIFTNTGDSLISLYQSGWFLSSINYKATANHINSLVNEQSKTLEYMLYLDDNNWSIYSPIHNEEINSTIPRIDSVNMFDSFWLLVE